MVELEKKQENCEEASEAVKTEAVEIMVWNGLLHENCEEDDENNRMEGVQHSEN